MSVSRLVLRVCILRLPLSFSGTWFSLFLRPPGLSSSDHPISRGCQTLLWVGFWRGRASLLFSREISPGFLVINGSRGCLWHALWKFSLYDFLENQYLLAYFGIYWSSCTYYKSNSFNIWKSIFFTTFIARPLTIIQILSLNVLDCILPDVALSKYVFGMSEVNIYCDNWDFPLLNDLSQQSNLKNFGNNYLSKFFSKNLFENYFSIFFRNLRKIFQKEFFGKAFLNYLFQNYYYFKLIFFKFFKYVLLKFF